MPNKRKRRDTEHRKETETRPFLHPFIAELKEVDPQDLDEIQTDLFNEQKEAIDKKYSNYNTRKTYYSLSCKEVKRYLHENELQYEEAVKILKPSFEDKKEEFKRNNIRYIERNSNERQTIDGVTFARAIQELKTSDNYYKIAACLCMATGRRPIEICKTMRFAESKEPHSIRITGGLAKSKQDFRPFSIPLLQLTSDEVLHMLHALRAQDSFRGNNNAYIASVTNTQINAVIRSFFGDKVTTSYTRSAYAYICYLMYGRAANRALYCGKILGHGRDNTESYIRNYDKVLVDNYPGYTEAMIARIPAIEAEVREQNAQDLADWKAA